MYIKNTSIKEYYKRITKNYTMTDFVIIDKADEPSAGGGAAAMERDYSTIIHDPKESRVFKTETPNGDVFWVMKHPATFKKDVQTIAFPHGDCNTCTSRAARYTTFSGPGNEPLFFSNEDGQMTNPTMIALREQAVKTCSQDIKPEPTLVHDGFFAPTEFTDPRGAQKEIRFYHWTIIPSDVTSTEVMSRTQPLWSMLKSGGCDCRLAEFMTEDSRRDMQMINGLLPETESPLHYKNTVDWVLGIQAKFMATDFNSLSEVDKVHVRIFAMMTGNAEGRVHFDFSTSSALKGFMESPSPEDVIRKMNTQSDPNNHMQGALARALDKNACARSSARTASLCWNGTKNPDDLDIHVRTDTGKHIYWDNTHDGDYSLDFDAGINKKDADPVENISCGIGLIRIQVDCYTRRTLGDIPFTVIIRENGEIVKEIPGIYPKDRSSKYPMDICTHDFVDRPVAPPQMSGKAASAAAAQDKDFQEKIGVPTSTVATMAALGEHGISVIQCKKVIAGGAAAAHDPEAVASVFETMMRAAKPSPKPLAKPRLNRSCAMTPSTVKDLSVIMASGQHDLAVHLPDHSPGYWTLVTAKTAFKNGKCELPSVCHYQNKFAPPGKTLLKGTARLDSTWVNTRPDGKVTVCGIAPFGDKMFFFLDGAHLPDVPEYPMGGGFYPQDLGIEQHVHRGRWTFFHTQLKPTMPSGEVDQSPPAIGTFLVGDTVTVFLDGRKLVLKV